MQQGSTTFLKAVVIFIGISVLALCIFVLPSGIFSDETGYYRPILIGLYIPAIPFFFALYQALRLLRYIDKSMAFSEISVKALRYIKYCALTISGLFTLGLPYIYSAADRDDAPGVLAIALIIVGASFVIATFAAVLQKLVESAIQIKTENDLTI